MQKAQYWKPVVVSIQADLSDKLFLYISIANIYIFLFHIFRTSKIFPFKCYFFILALFCRYLYCSLWRGVRWHFGRIDFFGISVLRIVEFCLLWTLFDNIYVAFVPLLSFASEFPDTDFLSSLQQHLNSRLLYGHRYCTICLSRSISDLQFTLLSQTVQDRWWDDWSVKINSEGFGRKCLWLNRSYILSFSEETE